MKKSFTYLCVTLALASLIGCSRNANLGPPAIKYGQDACSGCGMIISDDRFAAAIVNPTADSVPLVFDDAGCLLAYQRSNPAVVAWPHYFHDTATHQWLTADRALFVKTRQETPMGSGLFCFGTRGEADKAAQAAKGMVQTYSELQGSGDSALASH